METGAATDLTSVYMIIGGGIVFLLLTWWAIVDIAMREFPSQLLKVGWAIAVALVPFVGCLAYFIFGTKMGKRQKKGDSGQDVPHPDS